MVGHESPNPRINILNRELEAELRQVNKLVQVLLLQRKLLNPVNLSEELHALQAHHNEIGECDGHCDAAAPSRVELVLPLVVEVYICSECIEALKL